MSELITRVNYMANSTELHTKYYLQFAKESTYEFIEKSIGLDRIKRSKCPHLNDVVKQKPSGGWLWDNSPYDLEKMYLAGECSRGYLPSLSSRTCVGKAAAKHLLSLEKGAL